MKFKSILSLLVLSIILFSCSSDDDHSGDNLTGEGNIEFFFDNSLDGDDLLLGASTYTNSNGETLTVNRLSYIVSNFELTNIDGEKFVYPSNDSYFIISEEEQQLKVVLEGVPAGNYNQVKFGVGVPMERFLQGEEAQQEFWDYAASLNMTWAWIVGYKFINFEGTFTSPDLEESNNFRIHIGSHGDALDNYREVTLNFPNTARVRQDATPDVHLEVDANHLLDGENKFVLADLLNPGGTSQIMVDAERAPLVADNATQMFRVDHIHSHSAH